MPILKPNELDIISHSAEQTRRYGARLGGLLRAGDVICVSGDMGAGKTVFISGIGAGWGTNSPITSPTFNLVHEHQRDKDQQRLYHLDCYRLEGSRDAESIGLDDILDGSSVVLIEWPERIEELLPENILWLELRTIEDLRRNFIFEGNGPRYEELITQFREAAFGI